jgi:glycosyltransferase involved in cell wall biosynthesis
MYRIGFVIEQTLGHVTHTGNLQRNVPQDPAIQPFWMPIPYDLHGAARRVPLYASNWTVRAGLRARRALARVTRETSLDALLFHTQVPAVLVTGWLRRIPSVVSLDATPLQYDALGESYGHATQPSWIERQKWRLNRDCFRAASRIVTWSEWARRGLIDDYEVPADKVTVIPPGVNIDAWSRPESQRAATERPIILFVGADLERKGGLELLAAFRGLRSPGAELHLVTRTAVTPEPGVFVHNDLQPNSDRLRELYHRCDLFCLPTRGDCLPMALAEAGAAGLPLVSTRVGAISELVRDGETGFLIDPGDVKALTAVLRRLIEQPELRAAQGQRAALLVRQQHDAAKNTARLLEQLKAAADERVARPVEVPS